jgi:hypothetical protein
MVIWMIGEWHSTEASYWSSSLNTEKIRQLNEKGWKNVPLVEVVELIIPVHSEEKKVEQLF